MKTIFLAYFLNCLVVTLAAVEERSMRFQRTASLPTPQTRLTADEERPSVSLRGRSEGRSLRRDVGLDDKSPASLTCSLSKRILEEHLNETTRTWCINRSFLNDVRNDVQGIVNCTKPGDVLTFSPERRIRPSSRVVVPWPLTLTASVSSSDLDQGVFPRSEEKTVFACPTDHDGVFLVKSGGVLLANLVFEGCIFNTTNSDEDAIVGIDSDDCASSHSDGVVRLHHVDFRRNTLAESNAIRVRSPSCLNLELVDFGLKDSTCGGPCIVFPSTRRNRLRDIRVQNISSSEEAADATTVFWGPSDSKIDVTLLTAVDSTTQIFRIEDGSLVLEDSMLANNSPSVGSPIYLTKSSGHFQNVSFTGNVASHSAGSLMSDNSMIRVAHCTFADGEAAEFGGFVNAQEHSQVTIRASTFRHGQAKSGGCLRAHLSDLTLHDVTLQGCRSVIDGAAILLSNVTASIIATTMESNRALDDGGCMHLHFSKVTGKGWTATDNSAEDHGGVIRLDLHTTLNLANSVFVNSKADRGGAVSQEMVSVADFTNVTFAGSSAATEGGAFYVAESETILRDCTFDDSNAEDGGFLFARKSTRMNIISSTMQHGTARRGACLLVLDGFVSVQNSKLENCTTEEDGGAMYLRNTTVHISHSSFLSNRAKENGGVVFAEGKTHLRGGEWTVEDNRAEGNGGGVWLKRSTIQVNNSLFRNNSAVHGGAVHQHSSSNGTFFNATMVNNTCSGRGGAFFTVDSSKLDISVSAFRDGRAEDAGGFIAATSGSSVVVGHTNMTNGHATKGGAVFHSDSLLKGDHLKIAECSANSTGGAFSFESINITILTIRLDHSIVQNNTARRGGGLCVTNSNSRYLDCSNDHSDCFLVTLLNTSFVDNSAGLAGGAIFTSSHGNVGVSCDSETDDDAKSASSSLVEAFNLTKNICPSWRDNAAETYGPVIASFASQADVTVHESSVTNSEKNGPYLYRSGSPFSIGLKVEDAFGQGPAVGRNGRMVSSTVSSPDSVFSGSHTIILESRFTELDLTGFAKPGHYTVLIDFDEEELESVKIEVEVQKCLIGEVPLRDGTLCEPCSTTTYNFNPDEGQSCKECPENGICTTRVILPDRGYWHPTPCSTHIQRCLSRDACNTDSRQRVLEELTKDVESCDFNETIIKNYTEAQCSEGYAGPLCGSCKTSHGSSLSSKCHECPAPISNLMVICVSAVILLGLSGITVRGTLSTESSRRRMLSGHRKISRSLKLEDLSVSSSTELPEIQAPGSHEIHGANELTEMQLVSEATMAQWKVIEMFKITLNYIQMTVLVASLDVGWAVPVLIVAETAEFFGGLAVESIRRSVVCLGGEDHSLHPTVWASIVGAFFIPVSSFLILVAFWITVALLHQVQRPLRYIAQRSLLSLVALWYITSVPVIKTTLSVVLCVNAYDSQSPLEDESISYWAVDTSLECFKGDHLMLAVWILLFVSVVYGGLLIVFVSILASAKELLDHPDSWVYRTTGFLYRGYGSGWRRYWEVAIVLRKAIIAFLVFCAHRFDSLFPITCAAVVIMLAMGVQIVVMPYREKLRVLQRIDLFALFVSLLTIMIASMLKSESLTGEWRGLTLSSICVVLNVSTFLVLLSFLFNYSTDYVRLLMSEAGMHVEADAGSLRVLVLCMRSKVQCLVDFVGHGKSDDLSSLSSGV